MRNDEAGGRGNRLVMVLRDKGGGKEIAGRGGTRPYNRKVERERSLER